MCGIVGVCNLGEGAAPELELITRMLGTITHRGPDEFGVLLDERVALGNARLSIVDLKTGSQPIANEDESLWIVFNGEIFNHVELRPWLEREGHRFRTASDTEVILHLYEQLGPACLQHLNGQFAIAIWDTRGQASGGTLFLARDRVGVRPLFYTVADGRFVFGSEIKSLLAHPGVGARIDPHALAEAFTFWATRPPRSPFVGIHELPPGHLLLLREGSVRIERYWELGFPEHSDAAAPTEEEWVEELRELLSDATRLRLRADVPVGAYLSGGLDSATIATLTRRHAPGRLQTFSIAFSDPAFDEREHQHAMVRVLGTEHHGIECSYGDIGRVFPEVVWHAEWPLLRTSPAPMFMLSSLVRQHGIKVVLTGEGADEFLGGYDIFKEDKLRRFWARQPASALRPLLLQRLYQHVGGLGQHHAYMRAFFGRRLSETHRPEYSHLVRWENNAALARFFSPELQRSLDGYDPVASLAAELEAHPRFMRWPPLARAQYLEAAIFMSEYLLSSQGDRMLAAHSVEGRFPFLDHRVIDLACRIPPSLKIRGLNEKYILKKMMRDALPPSISARTKQPYRAPIHRAFFGPDAPDYVGEVLSPPGLAATGLFRPDAVARLVAKAATAGDLGERDSMALVGILSTQLLVDQFCLHRRAPSTEAVRPLKVCRGRSLRPERESRWLSPETC